MGKAAERRKAHRRKYLAEISNENPEQFDMAWEMRLEAWLSEVRFLAKAWAEGGKEAGTKIFDILDEAMMILKGCEASVAEKYTYKTYDLICHECCTQVARIIDPRLYRLTNMNGLRFKVGKTARI
jgi:hypothetical protein